MTATAAVVMTTSLMATSYAAKTKPGKSLSMQKMFVVSSSNGFIDHQAGDYVLVMPLSGIKQILSFTEQPYRLVKYTNSQGLKQAWYSKQLVNSFGVNPPNAVLTTPQHLPAVVTVTAMYLHGAHAAFIFHPIKLGMFSIPTGRISEVGLTIDGLTSASSSGGGAAATSAVTTIDPNASEYSGDALNALAKINPSLEDMASRAASKLRGYQTTSGYKGDQLPDEDDTQKAFNRAWKKAADQYNDQAEIDAHNAKVDAENAAGKAPDEDDPWGYGSTVEEGDIVSKDAQEQARLNALNEAYAAEQAAEEAADKAAQEVKLSKAGPKTSAGDVEQWTSSEVKGQGKSVFDTDSDTDSDTESSDGLDDLDMGTSFKATKVQQQGATSDSSDTSDTEQGADSSATDASDSESDTEEGASSGAPGSSTELSDFNAPPASDAQAAVNQAQSDLDDATSQANALLKMRNEIANSGAQQEVVDAATDAVQDSVDKLNKAQKALNDAQDALGDASAAGSDISASLAKQTSSVTSASDQVAEVGSAANILETVMDGEQ